MYNIIYIKLENIVEKIGFYYNIIYIYIYIYTGWPILT